MWRQEYGLFKDLLLPALGVTVLEQFPTYYSCLSFSAMCSLSTEYYFFTPGQCFGDCISLFKKRLSSFILLPCEGIVRRRKLSNLVCLLFFSRAKDVILPAKPPVSFFSSRSPVLDLFQGQLDYAEHIRRDSEVVLLFFYAPWCGQSIAARAEIEQAASQLSDQVMLTFGLRIQ